MKDVLLIEDKHLAFAPLMKYAERQGIAINEFCSNYMYMYTDPDGSVSHFKHIDTREYLHLKID